MNFGGIDNSGKKKNKHKNTKQPHNSSESKNKSVFKEPLYYIDLYNHIIKITHIDGSKLLSLELLITSGHFTESLDSCILLWL